MRKDGLVFKYERRHFKNKTPESDMMTVLQNWLLDIDRESKVDIYCIITGEDITIDDIDWEN